MQLTNVQEPLISIVICTYNRCDDLNKTLESVFNIAYKFLEVIVVDNNSTDETKKITEKYPVKYIVETRQGVAYARNTGLEVSSGQYIGFIDDDELVNADWIAGMLKGFTLDTSVGAVTGPVIPAYTNQTPVWMPKAFHGSDCGSEYRLLSSKEAIGTGNSMFRTDFIEDIRFKTNLGRVKSSLVSGEDTDFVQQLYDKGYKGAYSPEAIVQHMIPPERTTLKWFAHRYFAEGITEYLRKGHGVFWRRLHKPVVDAVVLLGSLFLFKPKYIVRRILRLCQTLGIMYGPIYRYQKQRNL